MKSVEEDEVGIYNSGIGQHIHFHLLDDIASCPYTMSRDDYYRNGYRLRYKMI
jgi:hypothetical protein